MSKNNNDNRNLGEKLEDGLDEAMGSVQDFIYGDGDNYNEDIPATIEKPNGIRKINKVQTRRNILKRLPGKKILKVVIAIAAIALIVFLIRLAIEHLLLM